MRYQVKCKSLLLQKALENFLEDYLYEDGIIISDYEGDVIIGKDIKKPFSKSQLLLQLDNAVGKRMKHNELEIDMDIFRNDIEEQIDTELSFEEKIDKLVDEFSIKLKYLIKEEYGKK